MPANVTAQIAETANSELPLEEKPTDQIEEKPVTDTEKTEEILETVIETKENETISNESDWQKPISLKALKKKLNDIFVIK